jgi:FkbM family methyltransferase
MQSWRGRASSGVIRVARRLIANTPIQRLPLTTAIYRRVFRLGYPSDEVSISFRGVNLTLPTGDVTIVPGLIGGYYEKIELDVFERLCATSRSVVDVGANIGLFSCLAASRLPAGGSVVSFEPIPANLRYLRQNLERNGFTEQVVVEATAVGEHEGSIEIFLVEGSIGTHSASSRNALDSANSVTVPVVNLDAYARSMTGRIDVLKVDVEGYEGHVLRGARGVLTEQRPTLFIEYVPVHLTNCGFPPRELLDIVFDTYELVYLVDDVRGTIQRRAKADLLDRSHEHKNANLIAVDARAHPEHAAAVESFSVALAGH